MVLDIFRNPQLCLETGINTFIEEYNSPQNLLIVYYAGQSSRGTRGDKSHLKINGSRRRTSPIVDWFPAEADWCEATRNLYSQCDSDLLLLIDSCHAGLVKGHSSHHRSGQALLAPGREDMAESGPLSFTSCLTSTLNEAHGQYQGDSSRSLDIFAIHNSINEKQGNDNVRFRLLFGNGRRPIEVRPQMRTVESLPHTIARAASVASLNENVNPTGVPHMSSLLSNASPYNSYLTVRPNLVGNPDEAQLLRTLTFFSRSSRPSRRRALVSGINLVEFTQSKSVPHVTRAELAHFKNQVITIQRLWREKRLTNDMRSHTSDVCAFVARMPFHWPSVQGPASEPLKFGSVYIHSNTDEDLESTDAGRYWSEWSRHGRITEADSSRCGSVNDSVIDVQRDYQLNREPPHSAFEKSVRPGNCNIETTPSIAVEPVITLFWYDGMLKLAHLCEWALKVVNSLSEPRQVLGKRSYDESDSEVEGTVLVDAGDMSTSERTDVHFKSSEKQSIGRPIGRIRRYDVEAAAREVKRQRIEKFTRMVKKQRTDRLAEGIDRLSTRNPRKRIEMNLDFL